MRLSAVEWLWTAFLQQLLCSNLLTFELILSKFSYRDRATGRWLPARRRHRRPVRFSIRKPLMYELPRLPRDAVVHAYELMGYGRSDRFQEPNRRREPQPRRRHMKKRNTLGARLRYEFDKSMAAGPIALIGWLAVLSLLIIIVAGAFLAITGITPEGGAPLSLHRGVLGIADAHPRRRAPWAAMPAGVSGCHAGRHPRRHLRRLGLIGVLSSGIDSKLDELRKGRSQVLENDHTIILNWSPSIFDIISELVVANTSRKRPRIVIMANKDKVEMEDEIATKVPALSNTRIICRSGDPTDLYDLAHRQPAGVALDHRPLAGRRRSGFAGDQDRAGARQRSRRAAPSPTGSPPKSATQERRGRPRRRRQRSAAGARRRPDLPHRRAFEPAGRLERRLFRTARFRRLRDLHAEQPALVGKSLWRRRDGL